MGRYCNRVSSGAATGCSVGGRLGGTANAREQNHRQRSSIDTNVDSMGGERVPPALLYTHTIARKTNEISRRSDRKDMIAARRGGK